MKTDIATGRKSRFALKEWRREDIVSWFRGSPILAAAVVFSILAAFYWLLIASDRYIAETHVVVERTDLSAGRPTGIADIISGGSGGNRSDQLLMRDYLLSRDVVVALEKQLSIAEHYSSSDVDFLSRLHSPASIEDLHEYYLDHVEIDYDEYGGVLVVRPEAYSAEMAEKMSKAIIALGESFMNRTANQLARGQVGFLEDQVDEMHGRVIDARQAVLAFQNVNRVASPEQEAQAIGSIIAGLEARKSGLEVSLSSQTSFLVDDHPTLVELRRQIAAIDRQIAEQNSRLTGNRSGSLNTKAERFARLEAEAQFAEELYKSALTALENARVESVRATKSLSIIQQPIRPQEALLPKRFVETVTYAFFAFLLAGIAQLLVMIVRDHKD